MKKTIQLFLWLLSTTVAIANSAQPGIWTAGGTGSFTLLFPEDSTVYKKVQMQKELVSIQLYSGFAVVKGEYWMYNDTDELISMQTGYPIEAQYLAGDYPRILAQIEFDELFKLAVSIDGQAVDFKAVEYEEDNPKINSLAYNEKPKWYIWTTEFKPQAITKIEVYFIVNTNDSSVSLGYSKESHNGFIYVLETGASWKQPIIEGEVRMQLKDGLTVKDIQGVAPDSIFMHYVEENFLVYIFNDLTPTHKSNVVITYGKRLENFNFENITTKSEHYFKAIDVFSAKPSNQSIGEPVYFGSPYEISTFGAVSFFWMLVTLPIFSFALMLFIGIRKFRKRKKARSYLIGKE